MRKIAVAGLVLIASMVLGSSGWAQSQGIAPDLRPNSFFNIKGLISGTFTATPATLPSGACSGGTAGFAAQCAAGHTCSCEEDEGAKFTANLIGKGRPTSSSPLIRAPAMERLSCPTRKNLPYAIRLLPNSM